MAELGGTLRAGALPRLEELVRQGHNVPGSATSPEQLLHRFHDFDQAGRRLLRDVFPDRVALERFDTPAGQRLRTGEVPRREVARLVLADIEDKVATLTDLIAHSKHAGVVAGAHPDPSLDFVKETVSVKLFVVHGHNEQVKHHVQLVLARALPGADVIVLHEQPSGGSSTIIEKLERYATDVDFVVVLLTGDDQLTTATGEVERRARQNVVLELGYFLAKLGRHKVVALHEAGLVLPSDFSGVLYISYDAGGGWRGELLKELDHAGLRPDWAQALK
ncbi:TIR domain-containing protein [Blastococcus sp. TF02A-30]|uniref:TIR domain-containing protein n=1 Tax=Blastococcus sp. TF02A-30 TaxID=2250580 RepID=UPI000DE85127|nr:nucleotide-binding protein [Blastococcus sp. TF02A-30]RBY84148.1 hypothetical protein DQ241_19055 [Blastococcus sp. TF02A-30]